MWAAGQPGYGKNGTPEIAKLTVRQEKPKWNRRAALLRELLAGSSGSSHARGPRALFPDSASLDQRLAPVVDRTPRGRGTGVGGVGLSGSSGTGKRWSRRRQRECPENCDRAGGTLLNGQAAVALVLRGGETGGARWDGRPALYG